MAQAPTLYDFDVTLAHVDRNIDARLSVRTARHPSETLDRLYLRVLAYCIFHEERLAFGKGLSDPEAPDLEARDLTGELSLWIRVGKGDPARVQKTLDQNARSRIAVVFESPLKLEAFVSAARDQKLGRLARAELVAVDPELIAALAAQEGRRAKLSVTIVGDHVYVERDGKSIDGPLTRGSML